MARVVLIVVGVVLAAAIVALSYLYGGAGAGLLTAGLVWIAVLIVVRVSLPRAPEPRQAPPRPRPPERNAAYPGLNKIELALLTASTSARDYDIGLRPLLWRLALARMVTTHGVDEERAGQLVRESVGEEFWPLVRPVWPPASASRTGGVDSARVRALVERVEELYR